MAFCGKLTAVAIDGNWHDAHATFHGDMNGGETMHEYFVHFLLKLMSIIPLHICGRSCFK